MIKIIALAKYQGTIDFRAGKTYVLFAMVVFLSIAYSYIIPKYAAGYLFDYVKSPYAWMETSSAAFTTIVAGLSAVLIGGLLSSDVLSEEFESGSISRLISLPVRRWEVYTGKLLEKMILALIFALIFVFIALLSSWLLAAPVGFKEWILPYLLGICLVFMCFSSIGFILGPLLKKTSIVFSATMGIWVLFIVVYGLSLFKIGMSVATFAIPFSNATLVPSALQSYAINSTGTFYFSFKVASSTRTFTLSRESYLLYTVLFTFAETLSVLFAGLFLFDRRQIME